jgi:hypothetical protein
LDGAGFPWQIMLKFFVGFEASATKVSKFPEKRAFTSLAKFMPSGPKFSNKPKRFENLKNVLNVTI